MLPAKPTPPFNDDTEDGAQEPEFKPLTREEARQWRAKQPALSLWRLVGVQWLVGLLAAALAWLLTQSVSVAVSVLYGAACVALPSALMAYGLTSSAMTRLLSGFAQAALVGFLFWEGVKISLSVALLAAAAWVLPELNWIGLLVGLVLVLKVYWFGVLLQSRRPLSNG
jgi:ATP synthase protein I